MADQLPNFEGDAATHVEAVPVMVAGLIPQAWADPTSAFDARLYGDVEVQLIGTPSPAYSVQRSLDGTNFVGAYAYDKDGNALSSIAAAGIYSLDGGGYLKLTGGAGSTAVARAGA